jgi:hypothetical protein
VTAPPSKALLLLAHYLAFLCSSDTPLTYAALGNHFEVCQLLLQCNCEAETKEKLEHFERIGELYFLPTTPTLQ